MAVAGFKGPINGEYFGSKRLDRKPSRGRRVFVQTETGSVLGIELDWSDNARTVKRKLKLALDVPTEESSLVYGDMVLKNDLSSVRNHSPLLLTRNSMHRSSSTPCLSPTGRDLQLKEHCGPIEILGFSNNSVKNLVKEIAKSMEIGLDPMPVRGGLGGAYYFKNCEGEYCAIVKPTDEEPYAPNNPKGFVGKTLGQPGLKRSVRVGETGFREVAAYLLDHDRFANVPSTALVKITHSIFNLNNGVNGTKHHGGNEVSKIASLQQFIPHDFDASDHGTSSFPVGAVHKIGILDVRILNTDRHGGNILVRKVEEIGGFGLMELIPIDHGLCLPENLEDPYFEWIHWPQASIPFSEDELEYINNLDPFQDSEMLRIELPMIREACLRVLVLCTIFLKEAAASGLCLAEIGEMMSRQFKGGNEEPSDLEFICLEARRLLEANRVVSDNIEAVDSDCLFDNNWDEEESIISREDNTFETLYSKSQDINGKNECFKLEDIPEQEESGKFNGTSLSSRKCTGPKRSQVATVSKVFTSTKIVTAGQKSWYPEGTVKKNGYLVGMSSGNTIVNEQLPGSISFVKFTDIEEDEWVNYLKTFQKLLIPAFSLQKSGHVGHKQRQRLGTSCQF